jgi:hypothetical protein
MQSEESQIDPAGALVPNEPAKGDAIAETRTIPPGAGRQVPLWFLTLAAGLVVGALSWLVGQLTQGAFPVAIETPPEVAKMERGPDRSAIIAGLLRQAGRDAERSKAAAAYGLLGALLGVALGLIGGRSRGSVYSGWRCAVGGGLIAAVAGAGLAWVMAPLMYQYQDAAQFADPDFSSRFLLIHSLFHAGIGAGIGIAAGLALGWGLGDRASLARALIGGFFGALAGVFVFEMINTLASPLGHAETPLPEESLPRLAMYLGVAGGAAFLAGLAADARPRRSSPTSSAS